jgi:hypothetical protein
LGDGAEFSLADDDTEDESEDDEEDDFRFLRLFFLAAGRRLLERLLERFRSSFPLTGDAKRLGDTDFDKLGEILEFWTDTLLGRSDLGFDEFFALLGRSFE